MYTTNNFHYGIIPTKEYDLPATSQKSFYGKARIIEDVNGEIFLRSYDTLVAYINKAVAIKMFIFLTYQMTYIIPSFICYVMKNHVYNQF